MGYTLLPLLVIALQADAASYDGYRWFQVEVSIFSNEYPEYRDAELWSPERLELGYPERAREFRQLADILLLENFAQRVAENLPDQPLTELPFDSAAADTSRFNAPAQGDEFLESVDVVGPFAEKPVTELRLPDMARDSYLLLPSSFSDFQTTNSRLDRSPTNRLLFHGVWRQPVVQPDDASPLIVRGGRQFGPHHELEGTITIRFNANEDRVVIDTNLWLTEFTNSISSDPGWELPLPPGITTDEQGAENTVASRRPIGINRIVQMQQSRPMRSTEFHYLDHPAMGVVVSVLPYDLPPPATLDSPITDAFVETSDPDL